MHEDGTTLPRLVIGAPQGRSGKTTLSLGLCAAFAARGLVVQPFKKGPDYIDPSWLSVAAGRPCRSLDPFFLDSDDALREAFIKGGARVDLALIEGNHGLYDSLEEDGRGSTAAVARVLGAPVVLVINAARMTRSAAAMVLGYQRFEPETPIAAVVLNNVAGDPATSRHVAKLVWAIESACHLPVVGALPRSEDLSIPDRHLGLVPWGESESLHPAIEACRRAVEAHLDLDGLLELARYAPPLRTDFEHPPDQVLSSHTPDGLRFTPDASGFAPSVPIGILRDRAFSFYYPENLAALESAGARLVWIDALSDSGLPDVDALYIGGGFPEVFMDQLEANRSLRNEIRAAIDAGLPVYAECGGLMYLSRRIHWGARSAEMAGALPVEVEVLDQPQGHGYVIAECTGDNPFFQPGSILRGHEFHHSRLVNLKGELITAYRLNRGRGLGDRRDGIVCKNVLAAYTHLHADGSSAWAPGLVDRARQFSKERHHG